MSTKCSLIYACGKDEYSTDIHIFREAGTEAYFLEISREPLEFKLKLSIPKEVAEELAKLIKEENQAELFLQEKR